MEKIGLLLLLLATAWCQDITSQGNSGTEVTSSAKPTRATAGRRAITRSAVTECEKSYVESDQCLQNALFIGQERTDIPHSQSRMAQYCEEKKEKLSCIRKYGVSCLKNVPRQIYLTITKNVKKMFKEFCDTDDGQKAFLRHLECVKPEHLQILNHVLGRLTLSLEYVAKNVTSDRMIPHACCALYNTYEEIPTAMGAICAPRPTPAETIEFFRSLVRRSVGDILDISCGKFSSYANCRTHLKAGLADIQSYVTSGRPLPDNSFMTPLIQFAQKLDRN